MILLYRILTTLLYPLLFILLLIRRFQEKEDPIRYKEKIFASKFNIKKNKNKKLIWFHAASIGEFKSILPIIEELNLNKKNLEFLITTITLSSSNLAKEELKKFDNVQHRFFPFDVGFVINKFILLWNPCAIFLVDSEIWPNLIYKAKKHKIPIAIINARITLKTFKKWMIISNTAKKVFGLLNFCLTSNLETKNYLLKLNAKNVIHTGNIKLISKIYEKKIYNNNDEVLKKKKFWVAASTHAGEEEFCIQAHLNLKKRYKDIITIIVPRHINRVKNIKKLCENFNLSAQILNKNESILKDKNIIIVNAFGVLLNYFKYTRSVFIGKSTIKKLEKVSGQNPIDAAKLGCKIYHGPYVYNFQDIYKILKKNNISKKIENPIELSKNLIKDFEEPQKKDNKVTMLINILGKKTLANTMKNINKFLFNEDK